MYFFEVSIFLINKWPTMVAHWAETKLSTSTFKIVSRRLMLQGRTFCNIYFTDQNDSSYLIIQHFKQLVSELFFVLLVIITTLMCSQVFPFLKPFVFSIWYQDAVGNSRESLLPCRILNGDRDNKLKRGNTPLLKYNCTHFNNTWLY